MFAASASDLPRPATPLPCSLPPKAMLDSKMQNLNPGCCAKNVFTPVCVCRGMVAGARTRIALLILLNVSFPQDVNGTWWLLSKLQLSSAYANTHFLCGGVPGLTKKQRDMCEKHPDILLSVSKGARMGVTECQTQFRNHRWNCSTLGTGPSVFGNHMLKDSRESAFLYAINSAGVTHALIRSCSRGEIVHCPCGPMKRGISYDSRGQYSWGGCSHVATGLRYSRLFIDATDESRKDARALISFHNNRAGRKAVQRKSRLQCKCHGVSGSCASRTCWKVQTDFGEVGRLLKRRYEGAVQVTVDNQNALIPLEGRKPFSKLDLVYFEHSPDYCSPNKSIGGTSLREGLHGQYCDIYAAVGYDSSGTVRRKVWMQVRLVL
ncbi:protein Wnt-2b-A [Nephila pilipes]|uniref:Protein Wnt n=1 Tax=Nephila pilipes TaxID=299642 RepID=A0A8X6TQE4_NEPPI|nr:protein Wnt-2b-A [Nephila pilipes]